jgi:hypothetical protein
MQYVLVALQDVHKFSVHSHASVQKIQRKMSRQEQRAGLSDRIPLRVRQV